MSSKLCHNVCSVNRMLIVLLLLLQLHQSFTSSQPNQLGGAVGSPYDRTYLPAYLQKYFQKYFQNIFKNIGKGSSQEN